MKRSWTNIKVLEPKIVAIRVAGKTRRETADELGLKRIEIKDWINRHNKETAREEAGLLPKGRGVSLLSHCKNRNMRTSD